MTASTSTATVQLRFPHGDDDAMRCTLTIGPIRADLTDTLTREAEPCEGRCGADVAVADMAALGLLASPLDDGTLSRITVPPGLWERPRHDLDEDGEPLVVTTHHDVERCRSLRAGVCCTWHRADGCCADADTCDDADCCPCCPECPTCPELARRAVTV